MTILVKIGHHTLRPICVSACMPSVIRLIFIKAKTLSNKFYTGKMKYIFYSQYVVTYLGS
jgi:hypothetical protein